MSKTNHTWPSRILFPTALLDEEKAAFRTALRFALQARGCLTLLHIGEEDREHVPWERFPAVRRTLEEWRLLDQNSLPEAVHERLGLSVRKQALHATDVAMSVQEYMERHQQDLVVMATEGRSSWSRVLRPSRAEPIAEVARKPTLFLPTQGRSLLKGEGQTVKIERILVPVSSVLDVERVKPFVIAMAGLSEQDTVVTWLHVSEGHGFFDQVDLTVMPGVRWVTLVRQGKVQEALQEAARTTECDLVVMATHGTDSLTDELFGTTTERFLRAGERPVLAVPHLS